MAPNDPLPLSMGWIYWLVSNRMWLLLGHCLSKMTHCGSSSCFAVRQPCEGYIGELRCRFLRPANNHVKELGSKFPISQAMRWPQPWLTTWCSLLRSPESQLPRKAAPGFLTNRNYIINVSCFKLLNYSSNILLIHIISQGTVHNTSKTVPILSLNYAGFYLKTGRETDVNL